MPTAIVTGATGILGGAIIKELSAHPEEWQQIHAISRSKKETYPAHVRHDHLDLTGSTSEMANSLSGINPDYVFFAAYLQSGDEQELADINGAMLRNFLDALEQTGGCKTVKRVVLVTGAKQYGVHLGRPKQPMEESDPWLEGPDRPPNFYYVQQRILSEASKRQGWDWCVTYPNDVIGYAKGNFMNLCTSLGLYAAVSREISPERMLAFPGSEIFYTLFDCFTSSKLHARFCRWAATAPTASNQAFNVVNGDVESWQTLWPKVASYFGMKVPGDQFVQGKYGHDASEISLQEKPPIADFAANMGLENSPFVKQCIVKQRIDLIRWSQRQDVRDAWEALAAREKLETDAFENATWGFLGFVLGREYDIVISMNKARKAGFLDFTDTWESIRDVFEDLEGANILPKTK